MVQPILVAGSAMARSSNLRNLRRPVLHGRKRFYTVLLAEQMVLAHLIRSPWTVPAYSMARRHLAGPAETELYSSLLHLPFQAAPGVTALFTPLPEPTVRLPMLA